MEPLIIIVVSGLLGGIVLAVLFSRFGRGAAHPSRDAPLEPPSTSIINMAHIRVSGVGGLGMVAMAGTIAIFVPRIRLTMAIALLLGTALATVLIVLRRRRGPLPSITGPGAQSMLFMDTPAAPPGDRSRSSVNRGQNYAAAPAK